MDAMQMAFEQACWERGLLTKKRPRWLVSHGNHAPGLGMVAEGL